MNSVDFALLVGRNLTTVARMSLIVLVLVAAAVGNRVGQWWTTGIPLAVGVAWALLLSATGDGVADSPIPFVAGASTLAIAVGVALARWPARPTT